MNLKLIYDSGIEPLAVFDVASQLRYSVGDQDSYIGGLISAARVMAEIWNGRQQSIKRWDLALDAWPCGPLPVPNPYFGFWPSDAYRLLSSQSAAVNAIQLLAPLISVESVTWKDSSGNVTVMVNGTDYIVDTWKEPGVVCPAPNVQWPSTNLWPTSAIHVQFTAGRVPNATAYAGSGISTVALAAPGAGGYRVGDVLTFPGGVVAATITLSAVDGSGNPTGWTIASAGSNYSVSNQVPATGGHGSGATWNITGLTQVVAPAPEVPTSIKQGMMLLVNQWFVDRVPYDAIRFVAEPPFAVSALFGSDKLWK